MDELVSIMTFLLITVTLPTSVASYNVRRHEIEWHWALPLTALAIVILVGFLTGIPISFWHPHGREGYLLDVVDKFTRAFGVLFFISVLLGIGIGWWIADHYK